MKLTNEYLIKRRTDAMVTKKNFKKKEGETISINRAGLILFCEEFVQMIDEIIKLRKKNENRTKKSND